MDLIDKQITDCIANSGYKESGNNRLIVPDHKKEKPENG